MLCQHFADIAVQPVFAKAYVGMGVVQGRRPEMAGGDLFRSAGDWSMANAILRT